MNAPRLLLVIAGSTLCLKSNNGGSNCCKGLDQDPLYGIRSLVNSSAALGCKMEQSRG